MILSDIKDGGGHVWLCESNYKFDNHNENIAIKVYEDGVYHNTTGLVIGSFVIFDLYNDSVKNQLEKNNGWFIETLNGFIRQGKIDNILDEV